MKRFLLSMSVILAACPALAVDKLYTPYVKAGEWEVEYFGRRSFDSDAAKDNAQGHEFSLGYGVNDWWKTELVAIWERAPGDSTGFTSAEWENQFQLTEKGEYWADVGGLLAYEWTPQSGDADGLEAKLLLAKQTGDFFHVLNLGFEKQVGDGESGSVESGLVWSSRYQYNDYIQPGFEYHGDFGEVNDMGSANDHEHYIGPVVYGTLPFEQEGDKVEGLGYRAGYLFGVSDAASDGQFVVQLEYELDF